MSQTQLTERKDPPQERTRNLRESSKRVSDLRGRVVDTVSRRSLASPVPTPMLSTSYEKEGYDGIRNGYRWWFEAWGSGSKAEWTIRGSHGRPPTPEDLRNADYIVIAIQDARGYVDYKTRVGGLDL